MEEIEITGGTRITLDIPVHTQALIDGSVRTDKHTNIPTWDYKFTASVSIVATRQTKR